MRNLLLGTALLFVVLNSVMIGGWVALLCTTDIDGWIPLIVYSLTLVACILALYKIEKEIE